MTFENYETESFYDEMFLPDGSPRPEARQLVERIEGLPDGELVRRHQTAERSRRRAVGSDGEGHRRR